jgi:hypothetical protein
MIDFRVGKTVVDIKLKDVPKDYVEKIKAFSEIWEEEGFIVKVKDKFIVIIPAELEEEFEDSFYVKSSDNDRSYA